MQPGKVNVIVDAFWGSSGKGKFAAWLSEQFNVTIASSSNAPNAGHTVVIDGERRVLKCLPAACLVPNCQTAFLTGASVFDPVQLHKEMAWTTADVMIHDRAVVLTPLHKELEQSSDKLRSIASTLQGSAAAAIDKLLRKEDAVVSSIAGLLDCSVVPGDECRALLRNRLAWGEYFLHEVSQGYALSIDHGSHYPQCTSRNCTTARGLDDLGVDPRALGDVYLNLRPYPIRVGNLEENGKRVGFSGDFYSDCSETSWERVGQDAGMPNDEIQKLYQNELTTVTKRLRRVCTFSMLGFMDAVRTNGANKLLLNFAQYLDWSIAGAHGTINRNDLPARTRVFVAKLEDFSGLPVVAVGTGADHKDVLQLRGSR